MSGVLTDEGTGADPDADPDGPMPRLIAAGSGSGRGHSPASDGIGTADQASEARTRAVSTGRENIG
ncbi:MAG: hypothetical protein JWR24_2356 [Actinoallomurus sp.]|nr:hypothetical protein [Actinoallomurus sp.]